jgi:hypothetical protein
MEDNINKLNNSKNKNVMRPLWGGKIILRESANYK